MSFYPLSLWGAQEPGASGWMAVFEECNFPSPVSVQTKLKIGGNWLFADDPSKFGWFFVVSHASFPW